MAAAKRTGASKRKRPSAPSPAKRTFSVVLEEDENGTIVATVPELRGCHTQGATIDQAMTRIREAIALCLEDEDAGPRTRFIGVTVTSVDVGQSA